MVAGQTEGDAMRFKTQTAVALAAAMTVLAPSGAAAQTAEETAALCADPTKACGELVSPACLKRAGAGAIAAQPAIPNLPGVAPADCEQQLDVYSKCLRQVAEKCGQPPAASGGDGREFDDPRRELASLGVQWSDANFQKAMTEGDMRALELFVEGGKRLDGTRARFWLRPATRSFEYFRKDVAEFLLEKNAIDADGLCFNKRNDWSVYRKMRVSWATDVEARGKVVRELCYTKATLAELDKRIGAEAQRLGVAQSAAAGRDQRIADCVRRFKAELPMEQAYREASRFNLLRHTTLRPPRDVVLAQLNGALLAGRTRNLEATYDAAVQKGCQAANRAPRTNAKKLDEMRALRAHIAKSVK